ncbi:hypothetical protein N9Q05_01515 [bacterium]|nr:hypothetical protein [bacterium]
MLSGFYTEGRGGRTQRWHGLRVNGTKEDAAKSYAYYRNANNDETGNLSSWIVDTAGGSVTVDQFTYLGDGTSNNQGGADSGGSTPVSGNYGLVVLELNDSAEVFVSKNTSAQVLAVSPPVDLQMTPAAGVITADAASFVRGSDTTITAQADMDLLFGFNVSAASANVSSSQRFTGYSELTIDGTEQPNTFNGNYLRNNQGTQDTFGYSNNSISFAALTQDQAVGVSAVELSGTEGGGSPTLQPGWGGFWGINLDTMSVSNFDLTGLDVTSGSTGWGLGTWSSGAWGKGIATTPTAGTPALSLSTTTALLGVPAIGGTGQTSVALGAGVDAEGVSAAGDVNGVVVQTVLNATVIAVGVVTTGGVGDLTAVASGVAATTGVFAAGEVGIADADPDALAIGVAATGGVGDLTAVASGVTTVTGLAAAGAVGQVNAVSSIVAAATGVTATGRTGQVIMWGSIIPDPDNLWTGVEPSDIPDWTAVGPDPGNVWTDVEPSDITDWTGVSPGASNIWTPVAA